MHADIHAKIHVHIIYAHTRMHTYT